MLGIWDGRYVFGHDSSFASFIIPPGDMHEWVHLAGTYTRGEYRLYRNGRLVANIRASGPSDCQSALVIGHLDTFLFCGRICDVRVWTRARTADEIAGAFWSPIVGPQDGLVVLRARPFLFVCVPLYVYVCEREERDRGGGERERLATHCSPFQQHAHARRHRQPTLQPRHGCRGL